jgi:hypothetical protein
MIYEREVPGGALNLNSTGYPDHGRYGDLPLQGKIPTIEPGVEPGTSWPIVRSVHQATRLVTLKCYLARFQMVKIRHDRNSARPFDATWPP